MLPSVPLGAPVRVQMRLANRGESALPALADLSLKAGVLSGHVRGPGGAERRFRSLVQCIDEEHAPVRLAPARRVCARRARLARTVRGALDARAP